MPGSIRSATKLKKLLRVFISCKITFTQMYHNFALSYTSK